MVDETHVLLRSAGNPTTSRLNRRAANASRHALRRHVLFHVPIIEHWLRWCRRFLVRLQELQVVILLLGLGVDAGRIVEELLVERGRVGVSHGTLIEVVDHDSTPPILSQRSLCSNLLDVHHVLPNESVHLLNVGVVLSEYAGGVDSVMTSRWASLKTTEPLECAPECRLELQRSLEALGRLLVFVLAFEDVSEEIVARSTVRNATVGVKIKVMISKNVARPLALVLRQVRPRQCKLRIVVPSEFDAGQRKLVPILRRLAVLEDFECLVSFAFAYIERCN